MFQKRRDMSKTRSVCEWHRETFKEWWDKTKKPEIAEKAKTSIWQKLRESQAIVDQRKEQQGPNLNRNILRPER